MSSFLQGRTSLVGMNSECWASALDAVLEGRVKCPDCVNPHDDAPGTVYAEAPTAYTYTGRYHMGPREKDFDTHAEYTRVRVKYADDARRVAWVGIGRLRPQQRADLDRAFPLMKLAVSSHLVGFAMHPYRAKGRTTLLIAYRAVDVYALFNAIWPGENRNRQPRWLPFAQKYLFGFSRTAADELGFVEGLSGAKLPTVTLGPIPGYDGPPFPMPSVELATAQHLGLTLSEKTVRELLELPDPVQLERELSEFPTTDVDG